jgi:hypothetical protein
MQRTPTVSLDAVIDDFENVGEDSRLLFENICTIKSRYSQELPQNSLHLQTTRHHYGLMDKSCPSDKGVVSSDEYRDQKFDYTIRGELGARKRTKTPDNFLSR